MHYEKAKQLLKITFQTGAVYMYYDVPEQVYERLRHARSKGRYFNKYISGVFPFERL